MDKLATFQINPDVGDPPARGGTFEENKVALAQLVPPDPTASLQLQGRVVRQGQTVDRAV